MQLIDRDKLRAALENAIKSSEDNNNTITGWHYRAGLKSALVCLMNVPVVEERQHEHWTKDNKCSGCGAERPTQGINKWIYLDAKYCYACGATMDEVVKNDRTC